MIGVTKLIVIGLVYPTMMLLFEKDVIILKGVSLTEMKHYRVSIYVNWKLVYVVVNLNENALVWVVGGLIIVETLKATFCEPETEALKNWLKKYTFEL